VYEFTANFVIEPVPAPTIFAQEQYEQNGEDTEDQVHWVLLYARGPNKKA
jgi:hypothetical protein